MYKSKCSPLPLFYLLPFLFLIFTTCSGQENNSARENGPLKIDTNSNDSFPQEGQIRTDPLFFIDGQLCQHLRRMFQDSKGNLWMGTNVYGLMRYDGDTLIYFDEKDGLGKGRITGILEDKDHNVWFGTASGLSKYDGKTFTNFTEKDGLINNEVWSLMIDSKGIFWIGTLEGISQFDGERFSSFAIPNIAVKDTNTHLSYNRITTIMEDKNGTFWIGTDGFGICKYDGKNFTHLTKDNGFIDNNISEFLEDENGDIWIGTMYGGLSHYDGKSFTNYTQDGLIDGVEVGGFYKDRTGNFWFAAENNGVYRYDGKVFTNFYKKENLPTNGILSILEDKEGRFWFGGWGGLFRFDGKSFQPVSKDGPWAP